MNFISVFERIKNQTDIKNAIDLAKFLDCSPQNVSFKKKSGIFPAEWALKVGQTYKLSTDWIMTGTGPMRIGEEGQENKAGGKSEDVKITLIQSLEEEIKRLEAALTAAKQSAMDPNQTLQLLVDMNRRMSLMEKEIEDLKRQNYDLKQYSGNLLKCLEHAEEKQQQIDDQGLLGPKVANG